MREKPRESITNGGLLSLFELGKDLVTRRVTVCLDNLRLKQMWLEASMKRSDNFVASERLEICYPHKVGRSYCLTLRWFGPPHLSARNLVAGLG